MMLMYALERRHPGFVLAFAVGCVLSSITGRAVTIDKRSDANTSRRFGQRFLEGFEVVRALRRGDVALCCLVPGYRPQLATRGDHARAVAAAMVTLAAGLNKAA